MTDLDNLIRLIVRDEIVRAGLASTPTRAVTIREAAQRLSVDEKTIRRLIQRGELRGVRVGSRSLRVISSDIDALLASAEAKP